MRDNGTVTLSDTEQLSVSAAIFALRAEAKTWAKIQAIVEGGE